MKKTTQGDGWMRLEGPTPEGGSYAIAHFYDPDGKPCRPKQAASATITVYDENDKEVVHHYMVCTPEEGPDS